MPTVTYDYDLVSVYKLTPVADPDYVAPEEPTEPEEPGDEPSVEPEQPGDEPSDEPNEPETPGDKLNTWLEQQGANWQELGEAAKGLSIGAVITLVGAVAILLGSRKR